MMEVKFIAEVSSNHARSLERSIDFIKQAAAVGCAAVKFQLFRADELFAAGTLSDSEFQRRRDWELPVAFLPALADACKAAGIEFCCTPFYLGAVAELEPYVSFYKVASYELLWDDLLAACAKTGKPVVLSTGMATLDEIGHALGVLRQNGCAAPTLLHCTSAYPTPPAEANLAAIETIREAFACEVGWSDHTVEPGVIMRAIHRWGARVIEFHFDLDGKGAEFGGGHCWLPDTIGRVIRDVEIGLTADGSPVKGPAPSELVERSWRADPHDGLRPLKETRRKLEQAKLQ
jgi:sialic acid synthase SpsE